MATDLWTEPLARRHVHAFDTLPAGRARSFLDLLDRRFPPSVYYRHRDMRDRALLNNERTRGMLDGTEQRFPPLTAHDAVAAGRESWRGCAVMFTAGGEGERLRLDLQARGLAAAVRPEEFTKATFAIPGFGPLGTLQINLLIVADLCRRTGFDIPVIVSTGPQGSVTAGVIPAILERNANFGLRHLLVLTQEERLHLTLEGRIAWKMAGDGVAPATNPDETGGPVMRLKKPVDREGLTGIGWLKDRGASRLLILQATALYDPSLPETMAAASHGADCLGVGVLRTSFSPDDAFGAYVRIGEGDASRVVIVEQGVRNERTRQVRDDTGRYFLPSSSGFYAVSVDFLGSMALPDYATPPKEVAPGLPRAPKAGYAATDMIGLAKRALILAIDGAMYAVIKTSAELETVAALGKRYGLDALCRRYAGVSGNTQR